MLHGYKPLPTGLAILFLALLLMSLAVRFWAGEQGIRFIGPTHIAAGEGQVWVFASGELFRLSPRGESLGVYPSSQTGLKSDPIDLKVMADGRLLLAEQEPARIRLCHSETWECDSILAGAISGIKRQYKIIPGEQPGGWLLTDAEGDTLWAIQQPPGEPRAVLMLLFAILATPRGKRWTRPPPAFDPESVTGEVPETRRVHWLERNPRIERNMKWGERVFHASLIGLVLSILVVYALLNFQAGQDPDSAAAEKASELGIILLLGGVMLALLVPVVRLSVNVVSRRLGTDGKRLYIRLEDGRELAVDPSELLYTNRVVLYRCYMFPLLGGKGQPLYPPGELDTWLAPLLRKSRRVTWVESLKYQWKHQQSLLIWSLLAAIAASSLLLTLLMTEF
jgi:hypothetical protein